MTKPPDKPGEPERTDAVKSLWRFVAGMVGRLVFAGFLLLLFLAGMVKGSDTGREVRTKILAVLPVWEEKLTNLRWRDWFVAAGEKISSRVTGETREVLAPPAKNRFYYPVLSWEKQVTFPDRILFFLAGRTEVFASAAGLAAEVKEKNGSWLVRLDHGGGWSSLYYPLAEPCIAQDRWVQAGERLGFSGAEREEKFFWEIRYGPEPVSPANFFPEAEHNR